MFALILMQLFLSLHILFCRHSAPVSALSCKLHFFRFMVRNDFCFINQLKWFFVSFAVCLCASRKRKKNVSTEKETASTKSLQHFASIYLPISVSTSHILRACTLSMCISLSKQTHGLAFEITIGHTHTHRRTYTHERRETHREHKWINNKCRNSNVVVDNNESTTSRKCSRFHFRGIPFYFTHISRRNH